MASHGREDERFDAGFLPVLNHGADNGSDIVNATAADSDGHAVARLQARGKAGGGELAADFGRDVGNLAIRETLVNQ